MNRTSRALRRTEITLWVIGLFLLGTALGVTVHRWSYQAAQEKALLRAEAAMQLAPQEIVGIPPSESERPLVLPASPERVAELPEETVTAGSSDASGSDEAETALHSTKRRENEARPAAPVTRRVVTPDRGLLGRIEIPRLGVSAIVREGDDDATLRRAVGRIPGTALPGEEGNMGLAGHRDTFFRSLRRIEVGDRIRLVVPPNTYEYRVDSLSVVEPHEVSVLDSNGIEELTLVTCYPFRFVGPAPDRFVVKAKRID
jgi:sortase A